MVGGACDDRNITCRLGITQHSGRYRFSINLCIHIKGYANCAAANRSRDIIQQGLTGGQNLDILLAARAAIIIIDGCACANLCLCGAFRYGSGDHASHTDNTASHTDRREINIFISDGIHSQPANCAFPEAGINDCEIICIGIPILIAG